MSLPVVGIDRAKGYIQNVLSFLLNRSANRMYKWGINTLKLKLVSVIFNDSVSTTKKTQHITKMLFKEICLF
jgi:hypothetical protein